MRAGCISGSPPSPTGCGSWRRGCRWPAAGPEAADAPPEHAPGRRHDVEQRGRPGPVARRDRVPVGRRQRSRLLRRSAQRGCRTMLQPPARQPASARPPPVGRSPCRAGGGARRRLVMVRLLGGRGYWPYGLEQVAAHAVPAVHPAGLPARRRPRRPRAAAAVDAGSRSTRPPVAATSCMAASTMPSRRCASPARLLGHDVAWPSRGRCRTPGSTVATSRHRDWRRPPACWWFLPRAGAERRPGADRRAAAMRSRPRRHGGDRPLRAEPQGRRRCSPDAASSRQQRPGGGAQRDRLRGGAIEGGRRSPGRRRRARAAGDPGRRQRGWLARRRAGPRHRAISPCTSPYPRSTGESAPARSRSRRRASAIRGPRPPSRATGR